MVLTPVYRPSPKNKLSLLTEYTELPRESIVGAETGYEGAELSHAVKHLVRTHVVVCIF